MTMKSPKKLLCVWLVSFGLVLGGSAHALDLDSLIPANPGGSVDAGNTQSDGTTVVADSMKEGFQVAHHELMNQDADGVRTIVVESGIGILSTGTSSYNTYENINATLLSKRSAYNRAAMVAKQGLLSFFSNPEMVCENIAASVFEAVDSGAESAANAGEFSGESCATEVAGSLSGYTTFSVHDDSDAKTVRVSLISTEKTRGATGTNVGGHMVGTNLSEMVSMVLRDLAQGVLPPMGGKVISVSNDSETVVVGFGSAINRQNSNATIQRRLAQAAQQQAQMRANAALLGMLTGEEVYHQGIFDESQVETTEQFVLDPALEGEEGIRVLEEERSSFMSAMSQTNSYRNAVDGQLPEGIVNRTFESNDGFWTYSVALYSPSLTDFARSASDGGQGAAADPAPATRSLQDSGPADDAANPAGPSGSVSDADDL